MSPLADARAALETGPVCDACLGRPLARRSHGLTNAERGRALRTAVALADDHPFESTAPADCWVCEGLCGRFGDWADRAARALEGIAFETYQVGTRLPPLLAENDELLSEEVGADAGESLKSECNREVGKRLGERTDTTVDFERPDVLAVLNVQRGDVDVQVNPAFVYGRYRKLRRGIPQTEWPCRECDGAGTRLGEDGVEPCGHCEGTGYMYEQSVEQLIAPHVGAAMDGEETVFHGAGREDVDARMLGDGRPFVLEVKEPRDRFPDLEAVADDIDAATDAVEVDRLGLATHRMVERVKSLEASKRYRAAVTFDAPVGGAPLEGALADLHGDIEQRTPERVAHRRADRVRERTVYDADGHLEGDREATVELETEGGLYVKELVSGDGGRTEPSLAGLLGVGAAVTDLDVLAVEGDPPFEDPEFFRG